MHSKVVIDLKTGTVKTVRMYPVLDGGDIVVDMVPDPDQALPAGRKMGNPDHTNVRIGDHWDGARYVRQATKDQVNRERDRRLDGGVVHGGVEFQSDEASRAAIAKKTTLALGLMAVGKQSDTFTWISANNSQVTMTATEFYDFGDAVDTYEENIRFVARKLKDSNPIPGDYADDKYWPSRTLD